MKYLIFLHMISFVSSNEFYCLHISMHSLFRFGRVLNCILFVELNLLNLDQLQSHGQLTRKQGNFYGLGKVYDEIVNCTWVFHCIFQLAKWFLLAQQHFAILSISFTLLENWFPLGELTISKLTLYEVGQNIKSTFNVYRLFIETQNSWCSVSMYL